MQTTSVDVPPMSNPIARSKPASAATLAQATTPPAGPDKTAAAPRNCDAATSPPEDCMTSSRESPSAASSRAM